MFEIGELNSAMRDTLIQPIFIIAGGKYELHVNVLWKWTLTRGAWS